MSKSEAKRLLEDALANEELLVKLQEMSLEKAAEAACGLGYDLTADELAAELEEYRAAKAEEPVELLEGELDQVAGGGDGIFGDTEEAPDGHDMGCFLTYHGKAWSHENNTWCRRNYYCYTKWDECVAYGRTNTSA